MRLTRLCAAVLRCTPSGAHTPPSSHTVPLITVINGVASGRFVYHS